MKGSENSEMEARVQTNKEPLTYLLPQMILDVYDGVFLRKNLRLTLGMGFYAWNPSSGHWSKMLWVRGKSGIHNETLQGEWDLGWKSPRALQGKCYTENLLISALPTASMLKVWFKWSFHSIDIFQSGLLPLWFISSWKFRSCRVWWYRPVIPATLNWGRVITSSRPPWLQSEFKVTWAS